MSNRSLTDGDRVTGLRTDGSQPLDVRDSRTQWVNRFLKTRHATERLTLELLPEDQTVQSMPDVSPTKWHLAHTTWFFETLLLLAHLSGYKPFAPTFGYLFNSYYEAMGPRHPRPQRGLLSRPGVHEIQAYRESVTAAVTDLIESVDSGLWEEVTQLLDLGLNHEEQHQELILMDIKHVFSVNPLEPIYKSRPRISVGQERRYVDWIAFPGGLVGIGHSGTGFAFDNERPRHKIWLEPYRLASRLVTCGEYLSFIEDGGYHRPELWLSDGWQTLTAQGWEAPLYWKRESDRDWSIFSLSGRLPLNPFEPVCHVSYYEADAFARWAGRRLAQEGEWETAAARLPLSGNLADRGLFHPIPATEPNGVLDQMIGDVWEWTSSAYSPYPGYRAPAGAIGEYNGKFMSGQMVLRGGAAVTPSEHIRRSYRNFFPPYSRWVFSGVRLAEDA